MAYSNYSEEYHIRGTKGPHGLKKILKKDPQIRKLSPKQRDVIERALERQMRGPGNYLSEKDVAQAMGALELNNQDPISKPTAELVKKYLLGEFEKKQQRPLQQNPRERTQQARSEHFGNDPRALPFKQPPSVVEGGSSASDMSSRPISPSPRSGERFFPSSRFTSRPPSMPSAPTPRFPLSPSAPSASPASPSSLPPHRMP